MNNVSLIGRISSMKELGKGNDFEYINFVLAVLKNRKLKEGEKDAFFFKCVAYNKVAQNLSSYGKVGKLVAVTGSIDQTIFEIFGEYKTVYQIVVNEVFFLEKKETK